jgi:hypothetical protein
MTSERCDRDVWTGTFAHEWLGEPFVVKSRRMHSAICGGSITRMGLCKLKVEFKLHISLLFLTWALDGGERSDSRPGRFTSEERGPCTYWIGCWVGPRIDLDAVKKRKVFSSMGIKLFRLLSISEYPTGVWMPKVWWKHSIFVLTTQWPLSTDDDASSSA